MKSPPPGSLRTHGATEWNPVAWTGSWDRRHRSDTQEPEYSLDLNYSIDIGLLLGTRGPYSCEVWRAGGRGRGGNTLHHVRSFPVNLKLF